VAHARAARHVTARLGVLDGLRGIAIALVVWYHLWQITWLSPSVALGSVPLDANPFVQTGFLGVDLFFFLSGACLFLPYARAHRRGERGLGARAYTLRRAAKILPSYLIALAAFTIAHRASLGFAGAGTELWRHLLFVHPWFDGSYGSIDGVLWSIGIEVQFYVVFPFLAGLARRAPLATFAGMAGTALAYRTIVRDEYDAVHLISQLPGVLDLYAAGMLAAWTIVRLEGHAHGAHRARAAWTFFSVVGAAGCVLAARAAFAARENSNWPEHWLGYGRIAVAASIAALVVGAVLGARPWARVIANPIFVGLAIVSYNLYLWHAFVAHALLDAGWFGTESALQRAPATGFVFELAAAALALVIAATLTYAVERPVLAWIGTGGARRPLVAPPPPARVDEGSDGELGVHEYARHRRRPGQDRRRSGRQ